LSQCEKAVTKFRRHVKTQGALPTEDAALFKPRGERADQVAQDRRVAEDRRGAGSTWGGGGMTAKASEVAVAQTPRYDVTINPKTTEALGLTVPQAVL